MKTRIVAAVIHQAVCKVEIVVEETRNESWPDETKKFTSTWIHVANPVMKEKMKNSETEKDELIEILKNANHEKDKAIDRLITGTIDLQAAINETLPGRKPGHA